MCQSFLSTRGLILAGTASTGGLATLAVKMSRKKHQVLNRKVEKNYAFDSPTGTKRLADLFAGKRQLIVYHFMFGPDWQEGCPSCSLNMDHTDGVPVHLTQRDVSFV